MQNQIRNVLLSAGVDVDNNNDLNDNDDGNNNDNNSDDNNNPKTNMLSSKSFLKQKMDEWLGLSSSISSLSDTITIEDCIPLSNNFLNEFILLLQIGWNPFDTHTTTGSTTLGNNKRTSNETSSSIPVVMSETWQRNSNTNLLIEFTMSSSSLLLSLHEIKDIISLEFVYDSIQITKWLRQLMEYNLDTNDTNTTTIIIEDIVTNDTLQNNNNNKKTIGTSSTSLSRILFDTNYYSKSIVQVDDDTKDTSSTDYENHHPEQLIISKNNNTTTTNNSHLLIKSFFVHIDQLGTIQGHIYKYSTFLQQSQQSARGTTTTLLKDPTLRLQQYEIIQSIITKLQNEWSQHIQYLEYILIDWYRISNTNRSIIHKYLSIYWLKFISLSQQSSSSSSSSNNTSSIRNENTSAAGIKMTLLILRKILLGIQQSTKSKSIPSVEVSSSPTIPTTAEPTTISTMMEDSNTTTTTTTTTDNTEIMSNNTNNSITTCSTNNNNIENETTIFTFETITTTTTTTNTITPSTSTNTTPTTTGTIENNNQKVLEHLLFTILIPLHKVDGLVLWRDQMSMLELYHESLTQCIAILLQYDIKNKNNYTTTTTTTTSSENSISNYNNNSNQQQQQASWIIRTIIALTHTSIFPIAGNTPKQVLLLHEIDTYLSLYDISNNNNNNKIKDEQSMVSAVVTVIGRCMASEHSRVAERALLFVKNNNFLLLINIHPTIALRILLPYLVRSEPSWNPTVRKMTYNALSILLLQQNTTNRSGRSTKSNNNEQQQQQQPDSLRCDGNTLNSVKSSSDSQAEITTSLSTIIQICNDLFQSHILSNHHHHHQQHQGTTTTKTETKKGILHESDESENRNIQKDESNTTTTTSSFSLKAGMGTWRPPSSSASSVNLPGSSTKTSTTIPTPGKGIAPWVTTTNNQPPATVTGVAPWAQQQPRQQFSTAARRQQDQPPATITGVAPWAQQQQKQPPSTITGVAPWAQQKPIQNQPPSRITGVVPRAISNNNKANPSRMMLPPKKVVTGINPVRARQSLPSNDVIVETDIINEDDVDGNDDSKMDLVEDIVHADNEEMDEEDQLLMKDFPQTGYEYVIEYLQKIKPPDEENGISSWSTIQMAETPTYLPNLKFHDLVFGHDLGSGAFATVRYARVIDKTKSRSYWVEYAVKVISTTKIREMGYEVSVQREIASLLILSHHPGISRLISTFRFREGAYLVLEYASKGDLHTLLRKHGSLDTESTRFVIGEVVAAVASIHDMGFLYGDLKPENIVITETGHVKLTDFGGCRAITDEAKDVLRKTEQGLLKNLRDGDWKANANANTSTTNNDMTDDSEFVEAYNNSEEDYRVEGTTAYLPPEVILGAYPTIAADSWALGCVMYQCLSGRPPLIDIDDESTKKRIVTFDAQQGYATTTQQQHDVTDQLFAGKHASGILDDARDAIISLLHRDPSQRPSMRQIAEHTFFTKSQVNVFTMYQQPAYPLDVGTVVPDSDNEKWSRRQFSSIWSPQPVAYDISMSSTACSKSKANSNYMSSSDQPIIEGIDERMSFFSPSGKLPTKMDSGEHKSDKRKMMLPPS